MASTALTTTTGSKGRGVAKIDMSGFDPKKAAARANKFATAVGGSELGGARKFPGQKYSYSQGIWYQGAGKKKTPVKGNSMEVVVNVFHIAATWVKWENNKPTYLPDMYPLASDVDLPDRDTLNNGEDNDPEYWEKDKDGKPQDPWKPVTVLPIREADSDTVNHIELQTKSAAIAVFSFFQEIMESVPMHDGELPIIRLGSKKTERRRMEPKSRKDKKTGKMIEYEEEVINKFDVPVFEVIGWAPMKDCDDPDAAPVEASGEVGEVTAKARTQEPAKATKKAPAAKGKKKKVVEDEDTL